MAKKSNQEIEQYYFEMFRRDYALPEGTIVYGDKPDVTVEGRRKIGIEITRFYLEDGGLPESEQRQQRLREEVVSLAQQIFLNDGGKRIEFSVSFDNAHPLHDSASIAARLVEVAKLAEGFASGRIDKQLFDHVPELSFIYLNATEYDIPKWHVRQCYDGQIISMRRLGEIVRTKETLSNQYQPCDAYWLLAIVDSMNFAQDQEIQIEDFEKIESTVFEKVIVYKTLFGHVLEAM